MGHGESPPAALFLANASRPVPRHFGAVGVDSGRGVLRPGRRPAEAAVVQDAGANLILQR